MMFPRRRDLRVRTPRRKHATLAKVRSGFETLEPRWVLDSTVVFNEIMYHPASDEASFEWIELYNQQSVDMDLSGWSLQGGTQFTFAAGTILAGRSYLVVAASPASLQTATGITGVLGPLVGRLDNSSDKLSLYDNNQRLMDEVEYKDDGDWPVGADGSGASLAKRDPMTASALAESWTFSSQLGGTPKAANFPVSSTAPQSSTLVDLNANWAYDTSGTDLGTNWRTTGFNDSGWMHAAAPFSTVGTSSGSALSFSGSGATLDGPFAGYVLGWEFNVTAPITIGSVGWFDTGAGLSASHPVGIFNSSGTLLASATVAPGDTLVSSVAPQPGAGFRYHALAAPLNLGVGTYRVGGLNPSGSSDKDYDFVQSLTTPSEINYVHSYYTASGALTYPNTLGDREKGYFGASFQLAGGVPALTVGPTTYYFRTTFPYSPAAGTLSLSLESLVDDGAVFYINGVEVYRQNMPGGAINYATLASSPVGTAALGAAVPIPTSSLVPGANVLAVEVHQAAMPDTDAAFNARLVATVTPPPPSAANPLVFNEVASGLTGTFQIELVNRGSQNVNLGGYKIAIPDVPAREYVLPAQNLAPGAYLNLSAAQLGFAAASGEHLFLYGAGGQTLLDGVTVRDQLRGRSVEHNNEWLYPDQPTFGAANHFSFRDDIVINEIMYQHQPVVESPALYDSRDLISLGSTWRYNQSGDQGTTWRNPNFDDGAWSQGAAAFGNAAAQPYDTTVLAANPIAYWRLGENPPSGTANDSAPLAGAQNGSYTSVTTRAPVIGGTVNPSGDFNGSTSRVLGSGLTATGVFAGDWSIEGWFIHDASTPNGSIFSDNGASGNTNGPAMSFVDTTNKLGIAAVGTSTANISIDLGSGHFGKPVYAVITKTGGNAAGTNTITIYAWVDGVQLPTVTGSTTWTITPNDAYQIGRYRTIGVQYFDGAIDEVALYNRALTAGEVAQHFAAGAGNGSTGFVTPINLGPTTYYFRNEFTFTGDPTTAQLTIQPLVDDGAVYYLNGVEVYRQNMPAGAITYATLASTVVDNAQLAGPFTIPAANLIAGNNVLAVEVHQASNADTDVRFDVKLHADNLLNTPTAYQASSEEWIELYNRGSQTVDLGGWRLDRVIDYVFPAATLLAPGQYLVVAKDKAALQATYPNIAIVGNYANQLTNSGGRIELKDSVGNPVDDVQYYDGGNWPSAADGLGSSLELRDPDADNSRAEAWAASNEAPAAQWRTFTSQRIAQPYLGSFQSTVGSPVPPTGWNEFIFGLLDSGEVLLDDIHVIENPDTTPLELISNGTFESDVLGGAPTAWRFGGNHLASVVADPDNPAHKVLRIVATGTTSYMGNNVETTFIGNKAIVIGREYEVSFRAKWISGSQQLNNRAFFTLIPQTTILDAPHHNGTPGAVNSQRVPNIGPTFHDLQQQPAVPAAGQAVTVSVALDDPDTVASAKLWWAAGGGAWQSLNMTGVGGVYSAAIPGQAAGTVVQFYVEALDALGSTSMYPAKGPNARALYEVNDGAAAPAVTLGIDSYRLVMTTADYDFMNSATNLMSDAKLGATLIINESLVIYNVGVTIKGSQHSRSVADRVGFSIEVPPEYALRGVHRSFAIDRSSRSPNTPKPSPDEIVIKQFFNHAGGIASEYDDLVYVIAPRAEHTSVATLQMARLGSEYLDSQFQNGGDGSIYEYEMLFLSPGTTNGQPDGTKLQTPGPFADYDIEYLGPDKEVYRFHVQKENNRAQDDFDRIIALGQALELTGTALDAAAANVLDADYWMRTFAARSLIMDFDGYGTTTYRHNHNMKLYVRPEDDKVLPFLWDVDGAFSLSPTQPLWQQGGLTNLTKLIERPDNLHRYYGHLHDMISTTWNTTYMGDWMARYSSKAGQNLSANLSLVQQRANYVLSQLPAQVPFAITTNGGADFSVNTPTVNLSGNGWINVREIRIQGRQGAIPATWTSPTAWTANVPLQSGAHLLTFQAYDFQGNLIGTDSITITSSVGSPQQGSLRVTELQYHPADPAAGSPYASSDFEFVELQNVGLQPVDLAGAQLVGGVQFTFAQQTLAPGTFVLVVNNQAAFASRYGGGLNIAGEFVGNLNNGGEQIQLLDSTSQPILDFTYSPTWSASTDGGGPSLVIVNANAAPGTWNSASSWRASRLSDGSPGLADPVATVAGRHVFYNNSKFDGNNPAASVADDAAVATDKTPLLPGGTATFANYTSYSRGINGIMVDLAGLVGLPTAADFIFRVGNDNSPGGWSLAPAPTSIAVRAGAGDAGSSRVTIIWPDGAIKKQWLQVTVNPSLGLIQPDVFYFGNAVGEIGDSPAAALVNSTDETGVRNHPQTFIAPASIADVYDFNRDGLVNATDQVLARANSTTLATALKLISAPASIAAAAAPATAFESLAVGLALLAPANPVAAPSASLPTKAIAKLVTQLPPAAADEVMAECWAGLRTHGSHLARRRLSAVTHDAIDSTMLELLDQFPPGDEPM